MDFSQFKVMANGDLRILVEDASGRLNELVIPKGSNKMLGTDANGVPVLVDPVASTGLVPKAGTIALTAADLGTKSVVFAKPFPASTGYVVTIHYNGLALVFTITANPATGFTFTFVSTLVGTAYWTATPITG